MTQYNTYNLFHRARNYFRSVDIPLWFKLLNLVILIPALLWPFVFFSTIFFFDNPHNLFLTLLLFLAVNAYPIYLALLAFGNYKLYRRSKYLAPVLPLISLLALASGTVYIVSGVKENLKQSVEKSKQKAASGDLGMGFRKDKLYVYSDDTIIKNADPATFEIVNWQWEKDKSTYFYNGKAMPEVDFNSFVILQGNYSKDKNRVYFYNNIVVDADPATFKVDDMTYIGRDKFGCYKDGEKSRLR